MVDLESLKDALSLMIVEQPGEGETPTSENLSHPRHLLRLGDQLGPEKEQDQSRHNQITLHKADLTLDDTILRLRQDLGLGGGKANPIPVNQGQERLAC